MKLLSLEMHNFMPFGGTHRLDFPTDPSRNVVVVFGDNMGGKTSLLNALRWCLFGYALGRHMKPLDLALMVNADAAAKGDFRIAVYLHFEVNGRDYDLRRVATLKDLVVTPRNAGDFRVEVSLRRNGHTVRGDEIEHELSQLVPEQVSRFFLFDGELLQEYETLLTAGSEQGERIKEAIEQVLGVPALLDGRQRLGGLLRQAQTVQAKENKHVVALRSVAEQQLQLQERRAALVTDLAALQEREARVAAEIEEHDEVLASTQAAERAQAALDSLTTRHSDLVKREAAVHLGTLECLRDAWRDLLQPRLEVRLQQLSEAQVTSRDKIEAAGALRARIDQLRTVIAAATCAACGQPIPQAQRESAGRELGRLEGEMAGADADLERLSAVSAELTNLSRLRSTGAAGRLAALEHERDGIAIALTDIDNQRSALSAQLQHEDTVEIARVRALRDQLLQNRGRLQGNIATRRGEIDELTAKENELARVMTKSTDARSRRSNREVELYGALERIFAQGVDVLRNQLRQTVAERASASFLRLTTDKTYRGLEINHNYGLSIVDKNGRTVSLRSAGAEQIVAIALIDGLNRTARRSGPIVMDTPLGRLDPKHRASVLSAVPDMAEQVVLLVHEGEINRKTGLEPLASRIGAVFDIIHTSSSQSHLERIGALAR